MSEPVAQPPSPLPAARFREAISWSLVSEVMRRHPGQLHIEAHGGGGQYDELRIYRQGTPNTSVISLNRRGSAHFFESGAESWTTIWNDALKADDPKTIVDRLERQAGILNDGPLLKDTAEVLTIRAISSLLQSFAFRREQWECRSGYEDSSGDVECSVREALFKHFPLCSRRLAHHDQMDLLDQPAYRFWFLLRNGVPRLAFEITGRAWNRQEEELNMLARYRTTHDLPSLVSTLLVAALQY